MSKITDERGGCGWWLLTGRSINVAPLELMSYYNQTHHMAPGFNQKEYPYIF